MTQQAPQLDARSFIENVVASSLMTRDEATRALKGMPETDRGKVVARYLVKNDYLTRFQAERLLWGKTDGSTNSAAAAWAECSRPCIRPWADRLP